MYRSRVFVYEYNWVGNQFKIDCYKFKMLIVIPKKTTKKTKKHTEKDRRQSKWYIPKNK